jgi:hypothetical protein
MTSRHAAREHPGVVAGVLATAGLAWWWTVGRMAGMDAGPGADLGTLSWFTGVWVVMMAAMMLPSLVPTAAVYAALVRRDPVLLDRFVRQPRRDPGLRPPPPIKTCFAVGAVLRVCEVLRFVQERSQSSRWKCR